MSNNIKKKKEVKPVKHRTKLNQREQRFTSELVKTNGNTSQSLVNSGYSKGYVNGNGYKLMEKEGVKQAYERKYMLALKKAGVDEESLAQVQREGLLANKVFTFQGKVIKSDTEVPDHFIRQRFLETANKVRGDFAPEQHEHSLKRETAEEVFRLRVQKRQELENKMNGGVVEEAKEVKAEVVNEDEDAHQDKDTQEKGRGSTPPTPSEV